MTTLVWLRDDLRIVDNPAFSAAAEDPGGVVVLYLLDEESEHIRALGGAAKWWLDKSLRSLQATLAQLGVPLILRRGRAEEVVSSVARECGADRVLWNRRYGPARAHDALVKTQLREQGREVRSYPGDVLFEPWTIATQAGSPYQVYSAFWRACTSGMPPAEPLAAVQECTGARMEVVDSDALDDWALTPVSPDWSGGISHRWEPGEHAASQALEEFLAERVHKYSRRDFPAEHTGSELSPYLRWGEISPRQVWHRTIQAGGDVGMFLSELGWREFAKHTAFHFGPLETNQLNTKFDGFPWHTDQAPGFTEWTRGQTGFGIVDAGMKELWTTGFMHNRVRMITASLLTKNLGIDWRHGEAWFWDTLVDADEASNPFNWQWVAGCGADAAPYFRIFNPELQQKKFDPDGRYVSKWAPDSVLTPPILDLKATRAEALHTYYSHVR